MTRTVRKTALKKLTAPRRKQGSSVAMVVITMGITKWTVTKPRASKHLTAKEKNTVRTNVLTALTTIRMAASTVMTTFAALAQQLSFGAARQKQARWHVVTKKTTTEIKKLTAMTRAALKQSF